MNAFGNYFRSHGYRLPLPEHGTTIFALRYQLEYDEHPAEGSREFSPGGIILGSGNIGPITAYMHYSLGAGGGPGGTYLLFAAAYNRTRRHSIAADSSSFRSRNRPGSASTICSSMVITARTSA